MTPCEFLYIQRAVEQLGQPLPAKDRIKIQKTMSQILARSAAELEQTLVDSLDDVSYTVETV